MGRDGRAMSQFRAEGDSVVQPDCGWQTAILAGTELSEKKRIVAPGLFEETRCD
jgi:hypothetical protein